MRMQTFFRPNFEAGRRVSPFLYVRMVDGGGQRSIMSVSTKNFQLVAKVYERVIGYHHQPKYNL